MSREDRGLTFLEGLAALTYLDWTSFCHRIALLLRQPRRLLPWLLFLVLLGFMAFTRIMAARSGQQGPMPLDSLGAPIAAVLPAVYLGILGLVIQGATRRAPAALSSAADARFLLGADLPPRLVVLWLQLRQAIALLKGMAVNAVIWSIILAWGTVRVQAILLGVLAIVLASSLLYGVRLPVFVLARRYPALPVAALGTTIALIGFAAAASQVYLAVRSGGSFLSEMAAHRVGMPLGSLVLSAVGGSGNALLALALLAVAATAASAAVARDCYPEIWQASVRIFVLRTLTQRGRIHSAADMRAAVRATRADTPPRGPVTAVSSSGRSVPGGAGTVIWKEWLQLRRAPSGLRGPLLAVVAAAVAGGLVGVLAQHAQSQAVSVISGMAVYPAVLLSAAAGLSLAADLRRPLWWLSEASLVARLAAWTLTTGLRSGVLILIALVAAGVTAHVLAQIVWALPLVLTGMWLLRAIGLGVYVLLPAPGDMRGPGNLLRLLLTLVLLVPVAGIAAGIGVATRSVPLGLLVAAACAVGEAWVLILFAAGRLRGNGLAIAQAEQR